MMATSIAMLHSSRKACYGTLPRGTEGLLHIEEKRMGTLYCPTFYKIKVLNTAVKYNFPIKGNTRESVIN